MREIRSEKAKGKRQFDNIVKKEQDERSGKQHFMQNLETKKGMQRNKKGRKFESIFRKVEKKPRKVNKPLSHFS